MKKAAVDPQWWAKNDISKVVQTEMASIVTDSINIQPIRRLFLTKFTVTNINKRKGFDRKDTKKLRDYLTHIRRSCRGHMVA